jgi:hypothetical protein
MKLVKYSAMRLVYGIIFLLLSLFTHSQRLLKGIVIDAAKNTPLANASVFLNTTAIGSVSDSSGRFSFVIPNGRYELIVSMIGYETFAQTVSPSDTADFITVKMKIRIKELETILIQPYEKDGWQKWGRFFLESFIGTSEYSRNCKIKNIDVIKFRLTNKGKELHVFANEPLIIENDALGYRLQYQLEIFQFDFSTHYLLYAGYPFFQPMKGSSARQRKWNRNRMNVFEGSMMHFMRAIYRNNIKEEGFSIRALQKLANTEKERVKAAYSTTTRPGNLFNVRTRASTNNQDTTEYYNRILSQPDYINVVGQNLLTADSIAYSIDTITASMDFENYLLVMYDKEAPLEFRRQYPKASASMMSEITLINKRPVQIQSNGSYYNPIDFMSTGYWAWSEKIATLLPFDYVLPKE